MFSDYTRTTNSRSQEQPPLTMDDEPELDRGLPAALRRQQRWVSSTTDNKIEAAWGPRGPPHVCQVCQTQCLSHRALRLHVNTHFILHFCPCGFHDVFPYPVTVHKMDCFHGEYHIVDGDCFPEYLQTIRPVLKRAINYAALDIGFQQLQTNAFQRSPLLNKESSSDTTPLVKKKSPFDLTDGTTPTETKENDCPPPPSRLETVEERLLKLQEELSHLAPDLLSTTTGLYQLRDSVGRLKRRLRARQARHRSQSLQQ